eukprot:scaffold282396_cov18-Prasinocladus_malaysianus.AAC.1
MTSQYQALSFEEITVGCSRDAPESCWSCSSEAQVMARSASCTASRLRWAGRGGKEPGDPRLAAHSLASLASSGAANVT